MYRFKLMVLGLLASCMIHGAAETKEAQEPEYVVEVVPVKQRRLPCGLGRLRERCCGKPLPVIVNTTKDTILIRYHDLDINISCKTLNEDEAVARKVDLTTSLIGKTKFVVTPHHDSKLKDNVKQSVYTSYHDLKNTFRDMRPPRCRFHSSCNCIGDILLIARNPKKFTLNPEKSSNQVYELKPGFIYRIIEKAQK